MGNKKETKPNRWHLRNHTMFRRKNKPHQPSRGKLNHAISSILDQTMKEDSKASPEDVRLVLLKENPLWKLPEKRVARYLKKHLKARGHQARAEEIEADMDEETAYTVIASTGEASKEHLVSTPVPLSILCIPEDGHDDDPQDEETFDKVIDEKNDKPQDVNSRKSFGSDKDKEADEIDFVCDINTTIDTLDGEQKDDINEQYVVIQRILSSEDLQDKESIEKETAKEEEEDNNILNDTNQFYVDRDDGSDDQNCFGLLTCVIS